jgi:VWFA-related protein
VREPLPFGARLARAVVMAAIGGVSLIALAQQPPPAEQATPAVSPDAEQTPPQPTFRTGIDFVRVDAIVTDGDGNPVLDLEPGDFEVYEDGELQQIETFRVVEVTGQLAPGEQAPRRIRTTYDEETEASRDDVRVFVLYMDDYHVRRSNSMSVRVPLREFITNQVGPRDLLGMMYPLTPLSEVRLTRNHEAILRAVDRFEGRKWDYEPHNEFEYRYANYPTETVERIRNEVSLSGIRGLAIHLGGLREGRKSIIVVGEGYTNTLPPQLRRAVASDPMTNNRDLFDPFAGQNNPYEDTMRFFGETELMSDLQRVYDAANRNNASLYMLDPRGLTAFEFDMDVSINFQTDSQYLRSTQDTLRVLAEQTDGRAIVNQNDLAAGLQQMVQDSSAYYLIGYTSSAAPSDGRFHEIDVRTTRRGITVRARRGYWALTAEARTAATAPKGVTESSSDVMTALATLARPARGRTIETWVGTERAENGKTRVAFVWSPSPRMPGQDRREEASGVSLIASGSTGSPYFRGDVRNPPGSGAPGGPQRVEFEVDPGALTLRLAVEGRGGEQIDRDVQNLTVPDFTAPEVALSTPVVLRAGNALEFRQLREDAAPVPAAGREFRRTDRLLIRVDAYGPGGSTPTVSATLLNRAGEPMSELPVTPVADADGRVQIDLPLASLSPSEYLIEIVASAPDGQTKELIAFKLTS